MSWIQIVVLAIVQGLTEFLPVSSSGHLVLVPSVFGWTDQGLVFDVAVHFGSLAAVWIYFRRDIAVLIAGAFSLRRGTIDSIEARMSMSIALATIPAAVAGLLFAGWIADNLRSPVVVMTTLAFYGVLMAVADRVGSQKKIVTDIGFREAFAIGCAQALALIPGTSRSGITITAGMFLGLQRQDAARFSFLMSVPIILLATIYELGTLILTDTPIAWLDLAFAAAVSGVVAYLAIGFFMTFVNVIGLVPFALYRLVLAGVIYYVLV